MEVTNHLLYRQDPGKQTLHRRITPTGEQYEEQKERWNAVAEYLRAALKDISGCSIRTWLQGSYKFGTQVRPMGCVREFDIDLGIYFEWKEGANTYGKPHSPDDIRALTQERAEFYEHTEVIEVIDPPKPRCIRMRFDGNFHIDIPVYHLESGRDLRRLAVEGNTWEYSDPKAIYVWFVNKFDDQRRAIARRVIQYLKCWSALTFEDKTGPSSILLTVLVGEVLSKLSANVIDSDDSAFFEVAQAINMRLRNDPEVRNPVDRDEVLTDRMDEGDFDNFLEKLDDLVVAADKAIEAEGLLDAADLWGKIFQHFFPLPEVEDLQKVADSRYAVAKITTLEIKVRATPRLNENRVFEGTNQLAGIPRDCEITFWITNMNAFPSDAVVEWTVRNEGGEAEYVNDLGHPAGNGAVTSERSAYLGTHYMDCVVRHHGRILGARRVPVKITGAPMPKRNPGRPVYGKFRSKRR